MAEIFGGVKEDVILALIFNADVYISLGDINIFGACKVINTLILKILVSEVNALALFTVINGNDFICYNVNLVFVLIKEICKIFQ